MNLKYLYILLVPFCFIQKTEAQVFSDTIYFSANGQSVDTVVQNGYYKIIGIDTTAENFQFLVKEYRANQSLIMVGSYRSLNPDRKNGKFTWFYENGQKEKECYYIDNKLDGDYFAWHKNGQLKQSSNYINDLIDGVSKSWSADGKLMKFIEYKQGEKHGHFKTFYPNGNPIRIENYKKGKLIKAKCYTASGSDTAYFRYFTPPSFLGGDISKFTSWVFDKIQYPEQAELSHEEGEVKVKFTVNKEGKVAGIYITKRDKQYFNEEVIRVISTSPLWKPALRDIDSVDVSIEIPIKFKLP